MELKISQLEKKPVFLDPQSININRIVLHRTLAYHLGTRTATQNHNTRAQE